jgi:hypothetical protein
LLRFLADENFNNRILRGLLRRFPEVDIVRVQDIVGLSGAGDPEVLDWAAREKRILLTHDVSTIVDFAIQRVESGQEMPGVFEVSRSISIGLAIDDLLLLAQGSIEDEWQGQIIYLPLR